MRAAMFTDDGGPLTEQNVPGPTLDPDGVIVELDACGVCRSDWHAWQVHFSRDHGPGHVFGHALTGTVLGVGDEVETSSESARATGSFHVGDATCHRCQIGQTSLCEDRSDPGAVISKIITIDGTSNMLVAVTNYDISSIPVIGDF